jgi:hypothetical protein
MGPGTAAVGFKDISESTAKSLLPQPKFAHPVSVRSKTSEVISAEVSWMPIKTGSPAASLITVKGPPRGPLRPKASTCAVKTPRKSAWIAHHRRAQPLPKPSVRGPLPVLTLMLLLNVQTRESPAVKPPVQLHDGVAEH